MGEDLCGARWHLARIRTASCGARWQLAHSERILLWKMSSCSSENSLGAPDRGGHRGPPVQGFSLFWGGASGVSIASESTQSCLTLQSASTSTGYVDSVDSMARTQLRSRALISGALLWDF